MENEKPRDPLIGFKSVMKKIDSKGNDRRVIYLTYESAQELYAALGGVVKNERGINLDIHFTTPTYEGRKFDSGYAFVKATQEPATSKFGGDRPQKFVRKGAAATETTPAAETPAAPAASLRERVAAAKKSASN